MEANGREIRDILDLRFHTADVSAQLTVQTEDGRLLRREFDLSTGAPLGMEVEEFRPKACNNKCIFCFIDQLPRGVRRSLRFKDDDFRLSFLHGNYITLTNLSK